MLHRIAYDRGDLCCLIHGRTRRVPLGLLVLGLCCIWWWLKWLLPDVPVLVDGGAEG